MALNKQQGNMYEWVDYMWPAIKGKCSHDCSYCFMKIWGEQPPLRLDEKELLANLGEGNFIFVCHTVDMFAEDVPSKWITRVLGRLCCYPLNKYLLQSKNPKRYLDFLGLYPNNVILGTTIETNRNIVKSKAPPFKERSQILAGLSKQGYLTMVTIEPIFDFDLNALVELVLQASPEWVNIGADSKRHNLPEPPKEKIEALIKALEEKTTVKLKSNLKRLMR